MTDEPPGDDESPAVTALAIQISRLRQELDAMAGTQKRHGAALSDVTDLKEQIERILAILDTERAAGPTTPKPDGNSPGSTNSGPSPT